MNALVLVAAGARFSTDKDGITSETGIQPDIRAPLIDAVLRCGVSVPSPVLETLRLGYKLQPAGGLCGATLDGNFGLCRSVAQRKELLRSLSECGTCTPLIVTLAWRRLDIAKLFMQHGASTDRVVCLATQAMGPLFDSALDNAIVQPIFSCIIEDPLELTSKHENYWVHGLEGWRPLHFAAAFNASGIGLLARHINKYVNLIIR
jgi:hypothetical protein